MLLPIPKVLTDAQVARCRELMERASWVDGKITAGHQSAKAKDNLQIPENSPEAREMGEMIIKALERIPLFITAALPTKIFPPLFNRYENGMTFGAHVDNAIRQIPGTPFRVRDDGERTLLFDLDMAIHKINQDAPHHPGVVALTCCYHNLLRRWANA